jgi:transcriptional regulator with AAA-type ATPase domain
VARHIRAKHGGIGKIGSVFSTTDTRRSGDYAPARPLGPFRGLWELASRNRGTLFLNEVGELTLHHQAKILRALEEGVIRHASVGARTSSCQLGSSRIRTGNSSRWRGAASFGRTGPSASRMVIRVPGLAARRDDIAEHAQDIWRDKVTRRPDARLSSEILSILSAHSWPGGVRELRGLLETTYALRYGNLSPEADALYEAWEARGDSPLPESAGGSVAFVGRTVAPDSTTGKHRSIEN